MKKARKAWELAATAYNPALEYITMTENIIVAILSFIGTLVGSLLASSKTRAVLEYKIDDLQKRVDKHNQVIERTYKLEGRMEEAEHDIRDIKAKL